MIEKIRISLWDIFSFFLTGLLVTLVVTAFFLADSQLTIKEIFGTISGFPTAIVLVAAPLVFTLFGMVLEPFSNYFDKYIVKYTFGLLLKPKQKHSGEEALLKEEIRSKYLGSLNGKIDNPYAICKEYVETKQLSTTFMVFLSRYGFYRNCAFISAACGATELYFAATWKLGLLAFFFAILCAAVFKQRSDDFYSYMAPTVYRAFLIDKLSWVPADEG